MISPSGSPNSACRDSCACRPIAMSLSAALGWSSTGTVSYHRNGARGMLPHFSCTSASSLGRTSSAPSAARNSTPHWRLISRPTNGCPVITELPSSSATNVLPVPHCPLSSPTPVVDIRCLISQLLTGRGSGSPWQYIGGRSSAGSGSRSGSKSGSSSGSSCSCCCCCSCSCCSSCSDPDGSSQGGGSSGPGSDSGAAGAGSGAFQSLVQ